MAVRTLWEQIALHALARPPDWLSILSFLHRQAGTASVTDQTPLRLLTALSTSRKCRIFRSTQTMKQEERSFKLPPQVFAQPNRPEVASISSHLPKLEARLLL